MARLQTLLGELNFAFGRIGVQNNTTERARFSPGERLDLALADLVAAEGSPDHYAFRNYVATLPGAIQETLRSTLYYALGTTPRTFVTWAWAPAYDFEITVWQAPDSSATRGGITLLVRSRYPHDRHPLAAEASEPTPDSVAGGPPQPQA